MRMGRTSGFEQFCEYLLPYKCFEGQPLTEWRNAYYDICKGDIDLAYLCDEYKRNPIFAATEVNNQMKNTPQSFGLLKTLPIYDPDIILKLPFSNCATYCLGAVLIMRSKGIPVAYDFTPNWSTGNNGHSWNTVYTTRFGNLEFAPHTTDPGTVHYPYLKVPKPPGISTLFREMIWGRGLKVAEDYHELHDKLKHKPEFLFEEAQCLSKTGQHAEAIRMLERAKRLSGDPMIRYMIAKNRQMLGDYREAEEELLQAIGILPERLYPYYLLAKLYAEPEFYQVDKLRAAASVVLAKKPKVESTAIREMREEVKR